MSDIPQAVRAIVYERDGDRCVCCGVSVVGNRQAHHRLFRSRQGRHDVQNLILVCPRHHRQIHGGDQAAAEADGYAVRSGVDPLDVPVRYHDGTLRLLTPEGYFQMYDQEDPNDESLIAFRGRDDIDAIG